MRTPRANRPKGSQRPALQAFNGLGCAGEPRSTGVAVHAPPGCPARAFRKRRGTQPLPKKGTIMPTTTLIAPGIVCDGCANAVKKALLGLEGITEVTVDVPEKRVCVIHDARVTRPTIDAALVKAGYQPA
jgi:copper chaperone CopZ